MAQLTTSVSLPVYPAARHVVTRVLRDSTSLLSTRRPLWRPPVLAALHARLRAAIADGAGPFPQRWGDALADADDDVVQLAAEALYVHVLVAADLRPGTKRDLVGSTLARMARPSRLPGVLDAALDGGLTTTAGAFTRRRLSQLVFLLGVASAWRSAPARDRRAALACPWTFRDWLWGLEPEGAHAQREVLLHLVHPETFEATASREAKRRIVAAFGAPSPEGDLDRALLDLRAALRPARGEGFSFEEPTLAARWRSAGDVGGGSLS